MILREMDIWRRRPSYIVGAVVPLLMSTLFFVTFFGDGIPSELPIGVVDLDHSSLTRNFVRQLDATQLGAVRCYDTWQEARDAMQKGLVTSVCVLPEGLQRDVMTNRRPAITFYVNGLYFVGGALAYKDLLTMINLTSGGVQRELLRAKGVDERSIRGLLRPVDLDTHQIGNPTTDYGVYLLAGLLPGVLAMSVVLVLIYSIGTELKYGTSRHLLRTAGGSMHVALAGKVLLYFVFFSLLGWALVLVLYRWLGYPFAGSLGWMFLAISLMVLASEAIAVTIVGLIPVCRFALSVGALYSVLAFSMSGFSLPVETLMAWLQGFSSMFPLRHYYQFFVMEGIYAGGFSGLYPEMMHLIVFLAVPFLVIRRLEKAFIRLDYPKN